MNEYPVVIVGGGPTGMMLAAELKLAGVDASILESHPSPERAGSRAGGLHSRTIEVFDQRGIAERMLSAGTTMQVEAFNLVPLDISDFPTRHPYGLALWQNEIERILAEWIGELGVRIELGHEVAGLVQDDAGVDIRLADGQRLRALYVVGCDGGRSLVRKAAGIAFPGWDATVSNLIAEAEFTEEPKWGMLRDAAGIHGLGPLDDGKRMRVVLTEQELHSGEPTLDELRAAMVDLWGSDFGVHNAWVSRFTDAARQAESYRAGRILLAGDAAHIHYPVGGQGLGLGVQDAVNLGWKLAEVVNGTAPDTLLDSYQAERHPVAARVLRDTLAQVGLRRADEGSKALGEMIAELLQLDEARRALAGRMSGLDIHYDLETGFAAGLGAGLGAGLDADLNSAHPLLGRRMPDLDLLTGDGHRRVSQLLRNARPLLLNFGQPHAFDGVIEPWANRVRTLDVDYDGVWEIPVLGEVAPPRAVLIRPDGYVAWVGIGTGTSASLASALTTWFGPPRKARRP